MYLECDGIFVMRIIHENIKKRQESCRRREKKKSSAQVARDLNSEKYMGLGSEEEREKKRVRVCDGGYAEGFPHNSFCYKPYQQKRSENESEVVGARMAYERIESKALVNFV